jgi:predicted secreted protein
MNRVRANAMMSAAFCAALLVRGAYADDAAARRIIGFSPDGRYFAFEQYGSRNWSDNHSGYSEFAAYDGQPPIGGSSH